ncbi:TATA-box-binding protein C [Natrarchaeobius oligotrophus]|uniref:TATA-box-binding protein C n=1 Tax=Natrarchaeobius chitinivorans TaxID=1679083 RepID=A0A3N6PM28_NATCH|nr:TATA-box-binding protein C [Natrarchaeobius chitinivorans]RQH00106.1 TATA-box-binding protein C [Natrarchaeobius chitinivorans]
MEIVNIVATGVLNYDELDITELYDDLDDEISRLKPGRLDIQYGDETPLIMIYPAGTYTIPGATSREELQQVREKFINHLVEVTKGELSESSFSIKYMVFMHDLGEEIDLEALAIQLGFENVEYEPEQFAGLIYRTDNPSGVVLIFSSGKILFTGFEGKEEAETVKDQLMDQLL